jgi:hypothetical protein
MRWGKTQISKITNEKNGDKNKYKGNPETHRDCFEHLCPNKLENHEEIDKFLDIYNQPKLN